MLGRLQRTLTTSVLALTGAFNATTSAQDIPAPANDRGFYRVEAGPNDPAVRDAILRRYFEGSVLDHEYSKQEIGRVQDYVTKLLQGSSPEQAISESGRLRALDDAEAPTVRDASSAKSGARAKDAAAQTVQTINVPAAISWTPSSTVGACRYDVFGYLAPLRFTDLAGIPAGDPRVISASAIGASATGTTLSVPLSTTPFQDGTHDNNLFYVINGITVGPNSASVSCASATEAQMSKSAPGELSYLDTWKIYALKNVPLDTDHDGSPDFIENLVGGDIRDPDGNHNGIGDVKEFVYFLTQLREFGDIEPMSVCKALSCLTKPDADGDGFTNVEEFAAGTLSFDPSSHPATLTQNKFSPASATAYRGGTVTLDITQNNMTPQSAFQFDVNYPTNIFTGVTGSIGPQGSAAGKIVVSNNLAPGATRFMEYAPANNADIPNGKVMSVTFNVAPNAPAGTTSVSFSNAVSVKANGDAVTQLSIGNATVSIVGAASVSYQPPTGLHEAIP